MNVVHVDDSESLTAKWLSRIEVGRAWRDVLWLEGWKRRKVQIHRLTAYSFYPTRITKPACVIKNTSNPSLPSNSSSLLNQSSLFLISHRNIPTTAVICSGFYREDLFYTWIDCFFPALRYFCGVYKYYVIFVYVSCIWMSMLLTF